MKEIFDILEDIIQSRKNLNLIKNDKVSFRVARDIYDHILNVELLDTDFYDRNYCKIKQRSNDILDIFLGDISVEIVCDHSYTTKLPEDNGYYFVRWGIGEKAMKVYLKHNDHLGWTWGKSPLDFSFESIINDVQYPNLIQFSKKIVDVSYLN